MAFQRNVDGFIYTPTAAIASNTVVVSGGLIGVTRQSGEANKPIWAFYGSPKSEYDFDLTAAPGATKAQGTAVYVTAAGAITFDAQTSSVDNTLIGYLAYGIAATDTNITVVMI